MTDERTQFDVIHTHDGISSQKIQAKNVVGFASQVVMSMAASNDLIGQTGAVSSLFSPTYTVPNDRNSHTYLTGGYLTVTAVSVNTITLQVTYTDETNTSRTQSFFGEGLTVAAISTVSMTAFPPMTIRCYPNTTITMKTTIVGVGSETYDVGGFLMQIN